ncbi:hypothetical protein ACLM5H_24425 [Fredinandcohnia humi]
MLLGTLNAIALFNIEVGFEERVQYLDIFMLDPNRVQLYGELSIGVAMLGLLVYLYSEVRR